MGNEYKYNYLKVIVILSLLSVLAIIVVFVVWNIDLAGGVISTMFIIGIAIFGAKQYFAPQNIKSVTVTSDSVIIKYRKVSVEVFYRDFLKIEHYKQGLYTEGLLVIARSRRYGITNEIKDFHRMCEDIYVELSKNNTKHIADPWFQIKFEKIY